MKFLFLDIDGVLNSTQRARNAIPFSELMPIGLAFLRHLHDNGVAIVVSSTWRLGKTRAELTDILKVPVRDVTPNLGDVRRGNEIQAWLDLNRVTDYCILDDDSDMLESQKSRFVQTTHETGMQFAHMDHVCDILCVPRWERTNA